MAAFPSPAPEQVAKRRFEEADMGLLVEGQWRDVWYDTGSTRGRFVRKDAAFRNWITADGSAGPSGVGGFKAEAGRYHLYVSLACPWAHRTLIMRSLKGLEDTISVSIVHWLMLDDGWTFADGPGLIPDTVYRARLMREIYTAADPYYTGRVTVPVLWDKHTRTIVNNESSEIIRMLNSAFDAIGARSGDYYPETLRSDINAVNARIYDTLNNGVTIRRRHWCWRWRTRSASKTIAAPSRRSRSRRWSRPRWRRRHRVYALSWQPSSSAGRR
jgi:putative glutathione S-transferase